MLITLLLRVALAVPATPAVRPAVVDAALAEAAGVWAPYGVAIGPDDSSRFAHVVLAVVLIEKGRPDVMRGWRGALGAITFDSGGAPVPTITVFLSDIERFIADARVLGRPSLDWPPGLHDQVFGRVLGRVLAHEIGHYLLRSPRHAPNGLMRSLQAVDDLVAPSRHRFTLTASEVARLEDCR
jgi:hypothetical protein